MNLDRWKDSQDRCELFPMTTVQYEVYDLLLKSPPQIKHRIRNSLHGIMKAWGLKEIDKSMSCFRIITAQEEAECAIIHSIKRKGYKNSKKLKPYNHTHKASIWYIFAAFTFLLPPLKDVIKGQFVIEPDEKTGDKIPKIRFRFLNPPDPRYHYPIPPLDIQVNKYNGSTPELHNLENEIKKMTSIKGHLELLKYLQDEANVRNELLYASDHGVPVVSMDIENFLNSRSTMIYTLHVICLLIDFYPNKQLLVQQLLDILIVNLQSVKCNG